MTEIILRETISTSTKEVIIRMDKTPNNQELISDVIENLLTRIDFLGHELEFQSEGISETEFDTIASELLKCNEIAVDDLTQRIAQIFPLIKNKERIGTNLFSTLFRCEIETAQKALSHIITQSQELHHGGEE